MSRPEILECASVSIQNVVSSQATLLLDVRPYVEYQRSHIRGALSLRISSLLLRRLVKGRVSLNELIRDDDKQWAERNPGDLIIVYDDAASFSDAVRFDPSNVLHAVVRCLQREQVNCAFLHGGFTAFSQAMPDFVVCNGPCPDTAGLGVPLAHAAPSAQGVGCSKHALMHRGVRSSSLGASTYHEPPPPYQPHADYTPPTPCAGLQWSMSQTVRLSAEPSVASQASSLRVEVSSEHPMAEIVPGLYIGSAVDAASRDKLVRRNIGWVLNITSDVPNYFTDMCTYQQIPVLDTWNQSIQTYFEVAFEFLDQGIASGRGVLVHCAAGISRSAAFVIGYLMHKHSFSLNRAYAHVMTKRPIISPNLAFMGELKEFEAKLERDRREASLCKVPRGDMIAPSSDVYSTA